MAQKQQLLAESAETAEEKIKVLNSAQSELNRMLSSGEISRASAEYREYERELISAEQALQEAERAQKEFAAAGTDAGKEVKEAGDRAEKAGEKAKGSGDNAEKGGDGWQKLGNAAKGTAKAIVTGVTTVTVSAAGAGKAVWDMATEAAEASGDIDDAAKKVGTGAEEYQKWVYAARLGGIEAAKLDSLMVKQQKTFSDARGGAEAAREAYSRLGLDIDSIGSSGEAFGAVIEKLADMEDETARNALANDIFGKSYADLAPLLAEGSAGIAAWRQECEELGGVMSNEAVEAGARLGDSMDRLETAVSGVKNSVVSGLMPGIADLLGGFTDLISGNEGAEESIKASVTSILSGLTSSVPRFTSILMILAQTAIGILPGILSVLISSVIGWAPSLVGSVLQILQSILTALTESAPLLTDAIMQLLTLVIHFLTDNIPIVLEVLIKIVSALIEGVSDTAPMLIQNIVSLIPRILSALTGQLPLIIGLGTDLVLSLVQGLLSAIPSLTASLPTVISALLNGILSSIPLVIQAGIRLLSSLTAELPVIIEAVVSALPLIIEAIVSAVAEGYPLIIESGIQLLTSLISALPTVIITLQKAVPTIILSLVDTLSDSKNLGALAQAGILILTSLVRGLPQIVFEIGKALLDIKLNMLNTVLNFIPDMKDSGLNLIKGLWSGISDSAGWLKGKLSGFMTDVTDDIKEFFGIHSPSTLFRDMIGKNLVRGIGVGFAVEAPQLKTDLRKDLGSVADGLDADLRISEKPERSAGAGGVALGGIHFEIGTFINNTEKDLKELVEEGMQIAGEYIKREKEVFA